MKKLKSFKDLDALRESLASEQEKEKVVVRICMTGCRAYGAENIRDEFKKQVKKCKLEDKIEIRETGCHGFCARAPVVVISPNNVFYGGITPKDVSVIISQTMRGKTVDRLLYVDPKTGKKISTISDIPFYKKQKKIVLKNCGVINPTNVFHYIASGGYSALEKVLSSMSPDGIIEEIDESCLRGRGGAGFPTGWKWAFVRAAKVTPKYLICNADEGDPGAFMDRAILEGDPHRVLEGMIIAAFAMGAKKGYIYVRAEYPIAVEHLEIAISQAAELGLLGEDILGSGFNFEVEVRQGAGAFVCGEETALIASIEGKRGMPRPRPPFPAEAGLWGKPTNINNVETFANVPPIILKGGKWYASIGTKNSKGTKVFSLAGKVLNTGLVEVPMGITLKEIIFDIGGGILGVNKFKAVQVGGPSGGCVSSEFIDLPVDYESLKSVGAIMGSGGMIIADENTCMVEMARFFMNFIQNESCGKCVPCRIGTKRMLEILERFTDGKGKMEDLKLLVELARSIKVSSLCGLGRTAPNPIMSTTTYFKSEYEAHIKDKFCPATGRKRGCSRGTRTISS